MKWKFRMHTRHAELGLTLLEVLAAAMIFAMVMTVLIGTSSTAVHKVGLSTRRLEANLVADEILADLEIQMKRGIAPEVDQDQFERDQYVIRTLRTELFSEPGQRPGNASDPGTGITSMLGAELPEVAKYLNQYDIEVSWLEQNGPQTVTRTTFAYDWQNAATEFSDLFEQAKRSGDGGGQMGGGSGDSETGGQTGSSGGGRTGGSSSSGSNRNRAQSGPGEIPPGHTVNPVYERNKRLGLQ